MNTENTMTICHLFKQIMKIKVNKIILRVVFSILLISSPVSLAASQPGYEFYLPLIQVQSELFLDIESRETSLNFYETDYLISSPPPINWTGSCASCDPGTTSPEFRQAVLQRINYFRAMAGVPDDVLFSEESNLKAQAAALLMSVNRSLSHTPPETWTCYSDLAYQGASSSNLYLGINGWEAISGYMKDPGASNDAVGHRRWILYPQTRVMGSGDVPATGSYPASNSLVVFSENMWDPRPDTRDDFVAWPPPGYVPYPVVFMRWSFSYPGADFGESVVSMSREGEGLTIIQASIKNGYGENTLVWQVEGMDSGANWPAPMQDTKYEIIIENVIILGLPQDFSYEVVVFDPNS
jgi:uncharacterized protein YkwD